VTLTVTLPLLKADPAIGAFMPKTLNIPFAAAGELVIVPALLKSPDPAAEFTTTSPPVPFWSSRLTPSTPAETAVVLTKKLLLLDWQVTPPTGVEVTYHKMPSGIATNTKKMHSIASITKAQIHFFIKSLQSISQSSPSIARHKCQSQLKHLNKASPKGNQKKEKKKKNGKGV
jgi:hypothetical protein